jgi:multidrug efflux pump
MYGSMLSSFWVPLSQAIVSGLTFATLLTLVTTPAMLAIPHQLKSIKNRLLSKTKSDRMHKRAAAYTAD